MSRKKIKKPPMRICSPRHPYAENHPNSPIFSPLLPYLPTHFRNRCPSCGVVDIEAKNMYDSPRGRRERASELLLCFIQRASRGRGYHAAHGASACWTYAVPHAVSRCSLAGSTGRTRKCRFRIAVTGGATPQLNIGRVRPCAKRRRRRAELL